MYPCCQFGVFLFTNLVRKSRGFLLSQTIVHFRISVKAFSHGSGIVLNVQKYRSRYIFLREMWGGLPVIVSVFQKDELSRKAQFCPLSICHYKMINTSKFYFKMNISNHPLLYHDKFQNYFKSIRLLSIHIKG